MTRRGAANVDDATTARPRSPLAELFLAAQSAPPDDAATVYVQSAPFVGQVSLRGRPDDAAFLAAAEEALGLTLPLTAGGLAEGAAHRALWLGPDHWLIVTGEGQGPALAASLKDRLRGLFAAVLDVSGARMRLRLGGAAARQVLASGCTLDLEPPAFPAGHALQTPVGNATVILHCLDAGQGEAEPIYDLYLPRSQALSFWRWLEHAGKPYGLSVRA
jgi:sarcosine oxidase subunit gamma